MEPYRSSVEPVPCKQSVSDRTIPLVVDTIPNGSEHIRSSVNIAYSLNNKILFVCRGGDSLIKVMRMCGPGH